ncbi:uncharacterized protein LOC121983965 isoform X2 [Zingiber officinale]|uniref:uncharacterized protein LOC121983965 isoform X2 n=1 Tax=Zingiber officinale TaxID=94328 RepID=UPI001C4C4C1E|nr:uncharacterized protein LOC121983965 isoform X2 [Zingiber officinale]
MDDGEDFRVFLNQREVNEKEAVIDPAPYEVRDEVVNNPVVEKQVWKKKDLLNGHTTLNEKGSVPENRFHLLSPLIEEEQNNMEGFAEQELNEEELFDDGQHVNRDEQHSFDSVDSEILKLKNKVVDDLEGQKVLQVAESNVCRGTSVAVDKRVKKGQNWISNNKQKVSADDPDYVDTGQLKRSSSLSLVPSMGVHHIAPSNVVSNHVYRITRSKTQGLGFCGGRYFPVGGCFWVFLW